MLLPHSTTTKLTAPYITTLQIDDAKEIVLSSFEILKTPFLTPQWPQENTNYYYILTPNLITTYSDL